MVRILLRKIFAKTPERAGERIWALFPAEKEGIADGKVGSHAVEARRRIFPHLAGIEIARFVLSLDVVTAKLEREQANAIEEQTRREFEVAQLNGPGPVTALVAFLWIVWMVAIVADAAMVKGLAGMYGHTGLWMPWIIGFTLTVTPAVLMKICFNPREPIETRLGKNAMPWVGTGLVVTFIVVVAALRSHYMATVEAARYSEGLLATLFAENSALLAAAIVVLSVVIAVVTALLWNPLTRYVRIQIHLFAISRLRTRLKEIDITLAEIESQKVANTSRIKDVVGTAEAEYGHGVAIAPSQQPSDLSLLKVTLAVAAYTGIAMITGPVAHRLAMMASLGEVSAVLIAIGVSIAVLAGGLFFSLRHLKKDAPGPGTSKLMIPLATGLMLTLLVLLSGCGSECKTEELHVAVMLDVSKSVTATDEQLAAATISIASRLKRGAELTILPVNTHAGSIYEFKVPCTDVPFDDDLKAAYKDFTAKLPAEISAWRKTDGLSDYKNALTLAAERLELSPERVLIILGDMIDDRGRAASDKPKPPEAPPLPIVGFPHTKAYIGLLASTELNRLSDESRLQFEKNFRKAFVAAGINDSDLAIRSFGLQGIEAWADQVLGPESAAYGDFARANARRK